MPISPEALSMFLRLSVISLFILPAPSVALPADDLHLLATIFVVLFLCAIVVSLGFAAALYLFWRKKSDEKKNWQNVQTFGQSLRRHQTASNLAPLSVPRQPELIREKRAVFDDGISIQNHFDAFCSAIANSFREALGKIANAFKQRRGHPPPVTHFPSKSPPPSYVSIMSPNELSPQQYHKFASSPLSNGQMPSRLRSILKKPKTVPSLRGVAGPTADSVPTVSYRISVLRAENVPTRQRVLPPVPQKWEWNEHFRDIPGGDRVVEDRVEREECLRNGRLMAVERLTRTIRASADIGGGGGRRPPAATATYI